MKGFIELHHNDSTQTFYFPVDRIGVAVDAKGSSILFEKGSSILFENGKYYVDESIEEISAKIESTKGEATPCGNIVFNAITNDSPTPRQNIYYRTEDRMPTFERINGEAVLTSEDGKQWAYCYLPWVGQHKYWAPMPKIEVRE